MCCHPALTPASAIALTLRAVGGLTTAEIASAFLVPKSTMQAAIAALHDEAARAEDTDWPRGCGCSIRSTATIAHYRAAAASTASVPERHYLTTQAARLLAID